MENLIKEYLRFNGTQGHNPKHAVDTWITEHFGNLPAKTKREFIESVEHHRAEDTKYISFLKKIVNAFKKSYNEWPTAVKKEMGEI